MRRPLVAGNWKMNLNRQQAIDLAGAIAKTEAEGPADILVCPSFVYLDSVRQTLGKSHVKLGAQDVYFESAGAFTGETSVLMLKEFGCSFVILGHSERRHVMGETDEIVNRKVKKALEAGLTPILCVGEMLAERESDQTMQVIRTQIEGSLSGIESSQIGQIVVAYEPVWAIGTGKTATPDQAQEVHADLRKILAERYNSESSNNVRTLYGGSVKPSNAADLLSQPDIDGALVGGASLAAEDFVEIINSAGVSSAN